jgi:hypothetical protein
MCEHTNIEHITPKGIVPLFADNMSMDFWECHDCGGLFDTDPRSVEEDYEEINEMSEVRKTLFN